MVKIKYSGHQKEYLEFPEEGCKRSCKGAIHLRPNSLKEISEDEYAHIQKAYSHLAIQKQEQHKVHKAEVKKKKAEVKSEANKEEASEAPMEASKPAKRKPRVKANS